MAKADPQQKAELEENLVINQMVADTEREIWDDALSQEPLDLDGDTSLEQMGEGLEGEELEAEGDEGEARQAPGEDEEAGVPKGHTTQPHEEREAEGEEGDEELEAGDEQVDQPEDHRGFVPSGRLRETSERARIAEERAGTLETQLAEMRGQLTELSRRVNAPAQPQPQRQVEQEQPEPDMFIDPQGWKDWNRKQARKEAEGIVDSRLSEFERRTQERELRTVDQSFAEAANGARGTEFNAAYHTLTRLPVNQQNGQLVTRILQSRDPVTALFDWWEENGGPEFRARQFQELADHYGIELPDDFVPAPQRRAPVNGQRRPVPRQQHETRHVTRLPQSLNSVPGGGGPRRDVDPRGLDGSDSAIFAYATGRDT